MWQLCSKSMEAAKNKKVTAIDSIELICKHSFEFIWSKSKNQVIGWMF